MFSAPPPSVFAGELDHHDDVHRPYVCAAAAAAAGAAAAAAAALLLLLLLLIASCASTCDTRTDAYACGEGPGFDCWDVNASDYGQCPPFDPDRRARVGNGICDLTGATVGHRLNNARCGWDGGDW